MAEFEVVTHFHARAGREEETRLAVLAILAPVRAEVGCLAVEALQSSDDPRLFLIHSRWVEEAAYRTHRSFPHTREFLARVETLVDEPIESTRANRLSAP